MKDILHISIASIEVFIEFHHMLVVLLLIILVENAQHLIQTVVNLTMKQRNLHNDTTMYQTVYKWVRKTFRYLVAIVIICLMINVKHRYINVTNLMTKNINGNHRQTIRRPHLVVYHILRIGILRAEILPETERLRFKPRLLQFNEDEPYRTIILTNLGTKVNTKHGDVVPCAIGILVPANFNRDHFFLQQCREDRLCNSLVLHQIFEDGVVNGIGYFNNHKLPPKHLIYLLASYYFPPFHAPLLLGEIDTNLDQRPTFFYFFIRISKRIEAKLLIVTFNGEIPALIDDGHRALLFTSQTSSSPSLSPAPCHSIYIQLNGHRR